MPLHDFKSLLAAAALPLALAGCGGEEKAAAATPAGPKERHIYVSAVDCENGGRGTLEECSTAIQKAVLAHEKSPPPYKSLNACEAKEGTNKCERVADKAYRPRLTAFVFDKGAALTALPLYPTTSGYRTADGKGLSGSDDNLIFSKSARDAYEVFKK
jgi:uncharacterized protein YgiB involved in biofilm formation